MITRFIRWTLQVAGYDLQRVSCWPDLAIRLRHVPRPVVVDAGANIGQTAVEIRRWLPRATVLCVEPDPDTFKLLQTRVAGLPDTRAFQLALGATNEIKPLRQNRASVTNSLLALDPRVTEEKWRSQTARLSEVPVQVRRLQDWCAEQSVDRIHVLKTDCQGYDLQVLKGAADLLRMGRIDWLCVETLFVPYYEGQALFDEVLAYLRLQGYSLHGLYEVCRDSRKRMASANAVFQSDAAG